MELKTEIYLLPTVLSCLVKEYYEALPNICPLCNIFFNENDEDGNRAPHCQECIPNCLGCYYCVDELTCDCGRRMGAYEYFTFGTCIDCEEGFTTEWFINP